MSEEAALPQDTPSSAGNNIVESSPELLEDLLGEGGEPLEDVFDVLDTPSWNAESDVILLGV